MTFKKLIIQVNLRPIEQKLALQKDVSDEELRDHDEKVENFTAEKDQGIFVVFVLQIVLERLEQPGHFLIAVFYDFACSAFPQKFH